MPVSRPGIMTDQLPTDMYSPDETSSRRAESSLRSLQDIDLASAHHGVQYYGITTLVDPIDASWMPQMSKTPDLLSTVYAMDWKPNRA